MMNAGLLDKKHRQFSRFLIDALARVPRQQPDPIAHNEPRIVGVDARVETDEPLYSERVLMPAAFALANELERIGFRTFHKNDVPQTDGIIAHQIVDQQSGVISRAIAQLQVLPDPIYKLDANDEIVIDDAGDPVWDEEAMSAQKVPFWRVRFDVFVD